MKIQSKYGETCTMKMKIQKKYGERCTIKMKIQEKYGETCTLYNTSKSPSLVQLGAGLPLDSNAPSALINDSPTELRQN